VSSLDIDLASLIHHRFNRVKVRTQMLAKKVAARKKCLDAVHSSDTAANTQTTARTSHVVGVVANHELQGKQRVKVHGLLNPTDDKTKAIRRNTTLGSKTVGRQKGSKRKEFRKRVQITRSEHSSLSASRAHSEGRSSNADNAMGPTASISRQPEACAPGNGSVREKVRLGVASIIQRHVSQFKSLIREFGQFSIPSPQVEQLRHATKISLSELLKADGWKSTNEQIHEVLTKAEGDAVMAVAEERKKQETPTSAQVRGIRTTAAQSLHQLSQGAGANYAHTLSTSTQGALNGSFRMVQNTTFAPNVLSQPPRQHAAGVGDSSFNHGFEGLDRSRPRAAVPAPSIHASATEGAYHTFNSRQGLTANGHAEVLSTNSSDQTDGSAIDPVKIMAQVVADHKAMVRAVLQNQGIQQLIETLEKSRQLSMAKLCKTLQAAGVPAMRDQISAVLSAAENEVLREERKYERTERIPMPLCSSATLTHRPAPPIHQQNFQAPPVASPYGRASRPFHNPQQHHDQQQQQQHQQHHQEHQQHQHQVHQQHQQHIGYRQEAPYQGNQQQQSSATRFSDEVTFNALLYFASRPQHETNPICDAFSGEHVASGFSAQHNMNPIRHASSGEHVASRFAVQQQTVRSAFGQPSDNGPLVQNNSGFSYGAPHGNQQHYSTSWTGQGQLEHSDPASSHHAQQQYGTQQGDPNHASNDYQAFYHYPHQRR
jgi:hypothetical protein